MIGIGITMEGKGPNTKDWLLEKFQPILLLPIGINQNEFIYEFFLEKSANVTNPTWRLVFQGPTSSLFDATRTPTRSPSTITSELLGLIWR